MLALRDRRTGIVCREPAARRIPLRWQPDAGAIAQPQTRRRVRRNRQLVQRPQERRKRLTAPRRSKEERVFAARYRRPPQLLCGRGLLERLAEPALGRRAKEREGGNWRGRWTGHRDIVPDPRRDSTGVLFYFERLRGFVSSAEVGSVFGFGCGFGASITIGGVAGFSSKPRRLGLSSEHGCTSTRKIV